MDMHRLTASISDVSNSFQNTNFTIDERVCVSPLPYYLDWFERYHPNVTLNRFDGPFFLQCMNGIQGKKQSGRQWNRLLDAVVTILKYNKIKIVRDVCIKVFSNGTVSYITFSNDNFLKTTNNETVFPELTRVF